MHWTLGSMENDLMNLTRLKGSAYLQEAKSLCSGCYPGKKEPFLEHSHHCGPHSHSHWKDCPGSAHSHSQGHRQRQPVTGKHPPQKKAKHPHHHSALDHPTPHVLIQIQALNCQHHLASHALRGQYGKTHTHTPTHTHTHTGDHTPRTERKTIPHSAIGFVKTVYLCLQQCPREVISALCNGACTRTFTAGCSRRLFRIGSIDGSLEQRNKVK